MTASNGKPATDIAVKQFRLLFQWPLILYPEGGSGGVARARKAALQQLDESDSWNEVDALSVPEKMDDFDSGGYGEFVYFHDFAQEFLYPKSGDDAASFRLFERKDICTLSADFATDNDRFTLNFLVPRLTMHMFDQGVAMMSLELEYTAKKGEGLTLARCQTAIDHLRRTYVPFWKTEEKIETAVRVPCAVRLDDETEMARPPCQKKAAASLDRTGFDRNPDVFKHWQKMIAPLKLVGQEGGQWRDPSDERMPVNSFISLTPAEYVAASDVEDRAAFDQVRESDWFRIWDAEEPGSAYPYNPEFLSRFTDTAFYDRFAPDPRSGGLAVRHMFGEHHYAVVGAGWFFDNIAVHHWRRHYAQLSLIARFQVAMLLAISGRISRALDKLTPTRRKDFEREILAIQDEYLKYRHRYHFTGVSSQIQASEMYDRWVSVLGIGAMKDDVQDELQTATNTLHTNEQTRLAQAAHDLGIIAGLGVLGGLVVGAMGSNLFVGTGEAVQLFVQNGWGELRQFFFLFFAVVAFLAAGYAIWSATRSGRGGGRLLVLGALSVFAALATWLWPDSPG